jgi:hypothetical protein
VIAGLANRPREHKNPLLSPYRATDEQKRACESCIINMMPMRLEKLRQADLISIFAG